MGGGDEEEGCSQGQKRGLRVERRRERSEKRRGRKVGTQRGREEESKREKNRRNCFRTRVTQWCVCV